MFNRYKRKGYFRGFNPDDEWKNKSSEQDQPFAFQTWHWSYSIIMFAVFGCVFILAALFENILVPLPGILYFFLVCAFLTAVVQYRAYRSSTYFSWFFYIFYNLVGSGVVLATFLVFTNLVVQRPSVKTGLYFMEEYKKVDRREDYSTYRLKVRELETGKIYRMKYKSNKGSPSNVFILHYKEGIVGFKHVKSVENLKTDP